MFAKANGWDINNKSKQKLVMEDKRVSPDLDEDEELASLRLAALATLKKRANKSPEPETTPVNKILPINSIRITEFGSEHNSHKNRQSWRNSNQLSKRKGKQFSKPSQRSNLIVITPVNKEEDEASGKPNPSQLLLPQHKWFQNNEDSSSPKTERRTGPSRFNRHGSESESSDSDYEDSDDSYSNDTVLQDENSQLSPLNSNTDQAELNNGLCSDDGMDFKTLDSKLEEDNSLDVNVSSVNNHSEQASFNEEDSRSSMEFHSTNPIEKDSTSLVETLKPNYEFECNSEKEKFSPTLCVKSAPVPEKVNDAPPVSNKQKSKHVPIKFDLFYDSDNPKSNNESDSEQKNKSNSYRLKTTSEVGEKDRSDGHRSKNSSDIDSNDKSDSHQSKRSSKVATNDKSNIHQSKRPSEVDQKDKSDSHLSKKTSGDRFDSYKSTRGKDGQRDRSNSKKLPKNAILDQKDASAYESRIERCSGSLKDKTSSLSKNDLRFELKRKKETSDRENKPSPKRERLHRRNRSSSPVNQRRKRDRSLSPEHQSDTGQRKSSKRSRSRERSPHHKHRRYHRDRSSSSRSSQSSSSSSSTVTSSDSDWKRSRPISSVIQPVQSTKLNVPETANSVKSLVTKKPFLSSSDSDSISVKKNKAIEIKLKPLSNFKISIPGNDQRNNVPEAKKRGPVHMRLGMLPGKRIIQMPKDVEAAFVNSSSENDSDIDSTKRMKSSSIVVAPKGRSPKGDSKKKEKSEVPNAKRGRVLR